MIGDWIKMRTDLYRDPKVCMIADALLDPEGELAAYVNQNLQRDMTITRNVMRNVTVGALVTVWGVMRLRGKRDGDDLLCRRCAIAVLDDLADLPGFGLAMESVGWVEAVDEGIVFPNFFADYNVDPTDDAKAKNAERQRRYRERKKGKSDVTSDVTVTSQNNVREEKRREENKENSPLPPKGESAKAKPAKFDPTSIVMPDAINESAWREWCEYRDKKKKPVSEHAAKKQLKVLATYDAHSQQRMIDASIANDWQGLFPEKLSQLKPAAAPETAAEFFQKRTDRSWADGLVKPHLQLAGSKP